MLLDTLLSAFREVISKYVHDTMQEFHHQQWRHYKRTQYTIDTQIQ